VSYHGGEHYIGFNIGSVNRPRVVSLGETPCGKKVMKLEEDANFDILAFRYGIYDDYSDEDPED